MIVEDHPETRQLLRELLGGHAAAVRECASGEEAVACAPEFRPDFITMDVNLQTMSGLDVTEELRARLPEVEIVIVTESDSGSLRRAALRAGAAAFFSKDNLMALRSHFCGGRAQLEQE